MSNQPDGDGEPAEENETGEQAETIERFQGEETTVGSIKDMLANLNAGKPSSTEVAYDV